MAFPSTSKQVYWEDFGSNRKPLRLLGSVLAPLTGCSRCRRWPGAAAAAAAGAAPSPPSTLSPSPPACSVPLSTSAGTP